MSDLIPYTHWAYFTDRAAAESCGVELDARFDCLSAVDRSVLGGTGTFTVLASKRSWLLVGPLRA